VVRSEYSSDWESEFLGSVGLNMAFTAVSSRLIITLGKPTDCPTP
jgi:hypothetical protein